MYYLDEGPAAASPVLLLHGEPSWCYFYRKMIPILVAAGHRCIAPDLLGFGRSDKPILREDYTVQLHIDALTAYEAPFPDDQYKAGARMFPALIPCTPDMLGAAISSEKIRANNSPRWWSISWRSKNSVRDAG